MKKTTKPKSKPVTISAKDVRRKPGDLARLRARSKGPIDTSDIPPISQVDLESGKLHIVRRRAPARKVSLTLRLDDDVVSWFKAGGEGYQTRINEALREYRTRAQTDDPAAALEQIKALADKVMRRVS